MRGQINDGVLIFRCICLTINERVFGGHGKALMKHSYYKRSQLLWCCVKRSRGLGCCGVVLRGLGCCGVALRGLG